MIEMIEMSEHINELATALAKAQAALRAVPKGKTAKVESKRTGTSYSYKYADLADAFDVCRQPLADNGLSIVQAPVSPERGVICISTMLLHASGQWMRSNLTMEAADATPQSIGTIITYGRRYGLAAMIGLVTDDDTDAQDHASNGRQQQQPSGAQQGRPGGSANYNGTTRGEGAPRAAGPNGTNRAAGPTAADVRKAHAEAAKTGQQIEPLPEGLDGYEAKNLAEWHAYYTQFLSVGK